MSTSILPLSDEPVARPETRAPEEHKGDMGVFT